MKEIDLSEFCLSGNYNDNLSLYAVDEDNKLKLIKFIVLNVLNPYFEDDYETYIEQIFILSVCVRNL